MNAYAKSTMKIHKLAQPAARTKVKTRFVGILIRFLWNRKIAWKSSGRAFSKSSFYKQFHKTLNGANLCRCFHHFSKKFKLHRWSIIISRCTEPISKISLLHIWVIVNECSGLTLFSYLLFSWKLLSHNLMLTD